jgi:hypothetical protein
MRVIFAAHAFIQNLRRGFTISGPTCLLPPGLPTHSPNWPS